LSQTVSVATNKRRFSRRRLEVEVDLGEGVSFAELCFDTRDVSEGGMFIRSDLLLEVGETFWVSFILPSTSIGIRTRGKVVWVNRHPDENDPTDVAGMGVTFIDLSDEQKEALRDYLQQY
jgi:type IV pilus assembly protein PilZ